MSSFFDELEEENLKSGIFTEFDTGVSYPMGFPGLDQQLGFIQKIPVGDDVKLQYRIGLTGGTINLFVGPSSSGKTAACIQAANTITEPFGDDSGVLFLDAEQSSAPQRVIDLTGITKSEYLKRWRIVDDPLLMTYPKTLSMIKDIANKKEADKKRYMYNTGFLNIKGEEIIYYKPTVVVIDSLLKIVEGDEIYEDIQGLTSGGRDAIFRGKWLRNMLAYTRKYNIIVLIVDHLGNDIQLQPGKGGAKQLTFIPTGKNIPGGEKVVYYSSTIIVWQPINSKDRIKTEADNGYNGVTIRSAVSKSRSGPGGYTSELEFVQETGFDIDLTLKNFAVDKGLIMGRNPSCYFATNPDVKFDTRIFTKEIKERPELLQALYQGCRPELQKLLRVVSQTDEDALSNPKRLSRQYMRDMYI